MFWVPGNALRTKTCSDATFAGSSHGGDMAGGKQAFCRVVELARAQIRQRGMGETVQQLTAVLLVLLARQGRNGVRRIDGGDPRVRGGRRAQSRHHGAPGGAWIGAEDAGVEAELVA